jgi:hypothetical protein
LRVIVTAGLCVGMAGFLVLVAVNAEETWRLVTGWGINPWVYSALWVASVPPYWVGIFRIKNGLFDGDRSAVWSGFVLNRAAWVAPYVYAAVAGSGLPGWVRPAIGLFVATMVVYYVLRLRDPAYFVKLTESRVGRLAAGLVPGRRSG